jgi:hypothetical protein
LKNLLTKTLLHTFPTVADECMVYLSTRSKNVFIWDKQNPHCFEEVAHHSPHVMMWAGVTSELINRPYFFDVSVTGGSYCLLFHWLIPVLDDVGLLNSIILQQDGAPAHYATDVSAFRNNQFPLWTGQHGPFIWSSRSPNLITCNN